MFTYANPITTLAVAALLLASLVVATLHAPHARKDGARAPWPPSEHSVRPLERHKMDSSRITSRYASQLATRGLNPPM
jgi:hypothetical protein